MALVRDSLGPIGTKEKVESWIASTPEIQDPVETDSFLFDASPSQWSVCHQRATELLLKSQTSPERVTLNTSPRQPGVSHNETSCDSIFRKYFPATASVGSKLIPGFQKAARRRQTVSLLRKHAFRWANITYKKFVVIRTDGCNMIPWTDVREYFFPSCDDSTCEIVLLALKYSLGYPKMTRHIHPCSQREQIRFGDLFKVVQYGTILVDIDAVLANKACLWNKVEDMHASEKTNDKVSKCSYKCPENISSSETVEAYAPDNYRPPSLSSVQVFQRAHTNSPCSRGVNTPSVPVGPTDAELNQAQDSDLVNLPHRVNMVEFLGSQATMMWNTMSEGDKMPARLSKSFNDATHPKSLGIGKESADNNHAESSISDYSIRNPDSGKVHFLEGPLLDKKGPLQQTCKTDTELVNRPNKPTKDAESENTKVIGLRVNNSRLLPVLVPADWFVSSSKDIAKWLVPVYLVQPLCLNTHVAGKLLGVYRDFIVGRSCQTPGKRGYARLCTRLEGRNLTRWLYNMSETAGLIPTWTIVTSRSLLLQWRDFLQYVPNESVYAYELDPTLTFQFNVHPHSSTAVPPLLNDETKTIKAPCNSAKTSDGKRPQTPCKATARNGHHKHSKGNTAWEPPGDVNEIRPVTNWSTPLWEENELPSAQLREEEVPDWAKNPFEEVDWTKDELLNVKNDPETVDFLSDAVACAPVDEERPDNLTEVASSEHILNKKQIPKTEHKTAEPQTVQKKPGTPRGKDRSERSGKDDPSIKLDCHQSDMTLDKNPRKNPRGRPKKKTLSQSDANCDEDIDQKTPSSYSSLLNNNKLSKNHSRGEVSQELVNPKSYDKFVHRRNHKEEESCQKTTRARTRSAEKTARPQQQSNVSKSPRKQEQNTSSKQCNSEESSKGKSKNRFEGLTLWGEEDEISDVDTSTVFNSKPQTEKVPQPSTSLTKTVSWHIPGIYPRPKEKKCRAVCKTSPAIKNKALAANDSQKALKAKSRDDVQLPKAGLRSDKGPDTGPSSSLFNNVSTDFKYEPGGTFKRRQSKKQKNRPDPHVIDLQMALQEGVVEAPTRLMNIESPRKTEHAQEDTTIGKRITLRSLSESQNTAAQSKMSLREHKCYSGLNTSKPSPIESPKYYKSKREISKAHSVWLNPDTSSEKPRQEVKSDKNIKGGRKGCVIKQEPLDDSQSDSGFRIQVDRTEVTEAPSFIEQQRKLLEAINKQRKPNDEGLSQKRCVTSRWNEANKASKETKSYVGLTAREIKQSNRASPSKTSPRDCSIPSGRPSKLEEIQTSRDPDKQISFSFQPLLDPGQTVSNRGLAFFNDCSVPYVGMNGYKYITLKDAVRAFHRCKPGCCVAKALLRSHRGLHKSMCSWDQVYDFELTQPSRRPPVRTGDVLLRFDSLMTLLPALEDELPERHRGTTSKSSAGCGYSHL